MPLPFRRTDKKAWICLLALLTWENQAKSLPLPNAFAPAQTELGQGTGTLRAEEGIATLEGRADGLGVYDDNYNRNTCLLDYLLPQPIPLPDGCEGLSLLVDSPATATAAKLQFRVLIQDAADRLWAVGTRLGGGGSFLPATHGFEPLATYAWTTSELGRIDRWVAVPLDPSLPHDGAAAIRLPVRLAGFQVGAGIVDKEFRLAVTGIGEAGKEAKPDPYWTLYPQAIWNLRLGSSGFHGRFGFGAAAPAPFLRPSDLSLPAGEYQAAWEILGADEWTPVASGTAAWKAGGEADALAFPPLPAGSYQLRLTCVKSGEARLREFAMGCVVIRNGTAPSPPPTPDKALLSWSSNSPRGNVWTDGEAARIELRSGTAPLSRIDWDVRSADGQPLASGSAQAEASLDLTPFLRDHAAVWITATLFSDGRPILVSRRIAGRTSLPPQAAAAAAAPSKLDRFRGIFRRTRGDWNEGFCPEATQAKRIDAEIEPWLDEAAQTGYNVVELGALWADLNPLPGVYQFEYLDRLVAAAEKRGLAVTLRVHPEFQQIPDWVPRELMEDEAGFAHGLWNGASLLLCSPASVAFSRAFDDFLQALAAHYHGDPLVLGTTLGSLFYDHDLLDLPWCAQNVDYSEAMRRSFVATLHEEYGGDVTRAATAHGATYRSWDDVRIPHPEMQRDDAGRLRPRTDALWNDWIAYKVAAMRDFRLDAARALRRGDPSCYVGIYNTDTTPLYLDAIQAGKYEMTMGSMESQFPPEDTRLTGRFEPIAKAAQWPVLVDVGMTNILLTGAPGRDSFFSYWMLSWRLATVKEAVRTAEARLKQWFSVVDPLVGAEPMDTPPEEGVYGVSYRPLLDTLQHTFTGRADDMNKPFLYRAEVDKVHLRAAFPEALPESLRRAPYFYLPYWDDVEKADEPALLKDYVARGGTLLLEATSGFWGVQGHDTPLPGFLGSALGLPRAEPRTSSSAQEEASWTTQAGAALRSASLSLRTGPFASPTNDQPTPWIQNIPHAFLRPYRFPGALPPGAITLATFPDKSPAAILLPLGKGRIVLFCGTLDWIGSPGLAAALNAWAIGHDGPLPPPADPESIARAFRKQDHYFLIGRRFIGQGNLAAWMKDTPPPSPPARELAVHFPAGLPSDRRYHVRELLSGHDFGVLSGADLRNGLSLSLRPGEGFVVDATLSP